MYNMLCNMLCNTLCNMLWNICYVTRYITCSKHTIDWLNWNTALDKGPLDILQLWSFSPVHSDMVLNDVFTGREHAGIISIEWRQVPSLVTHK